MAFFGFVWTYGALKLPPHQMPACCRVWMIISTFWEKLKFARRGGSIRIWASTIQERGKWNGYLFLSPLSLKLLLFAVWLAQRSCYVPTRARYYSIRSPMEDVSSFYKWRNHRLQKNFQQVKNIDKVLTLSHQAGGTIKVPKLHFFERKFNVLHTYSCLFA